MQQLEVHAYKALQWVWVPLVVMLSKPCPLQQVMGGSSRPRLVFLLLVIEPGVCGNEVAGESHYSETSILRIKRGLIGIGEKAQETSSDTDMHNTMHLCHHHTA